MEPNLNIGDVAIIYKVKAEEVELNDIIAYQTEKQIILHRVLEIREKNEKYTFITKGDNNTQEDTNPVEEYQLLGKVIFKIPYLGYPSIWLNITDNYK